MSTNEQINAYIAQRGITPEQIGLSPEQMQDGAEIDCITYYDACKCLGVPLETFLKE